MDAEFIQDYCLQKYGVTEGFPFGNETLVFKVKEKIFLLLSLSAQPLQFNAKCDPAEAIELREQYDAVKPGYHMNKKMWNTVVIDGSIPAAVLKKMIDDSYQLVVQSLPKKLQAEINAGS